MKSLPIIAIVVLGAASACSVQQQAVQQPAPAPARGTAGVVPDPVQPAGTTIATNSPGTMVISDFDPPMRIDVSR